MVEKVADEKKSVDFQRFFLCYTLDCSGQILFNHSIGSLEGNIPFQRAFDYLQLASEKRMSNPLLELFADPKYEESVKICNDFVAKIIDSAKSDPNLKDRKDLLAHFMTSFAFFILFFLYFFFFFSSVIN